jgi:hypothetical protein
VVTSSDTISPLFFEGIPRKATHFNHPAHHVKILHLPSNIPESHRLPISTTQILQNRQSILNHVGVQLFSVLLKEGDAVLAKSSQFLYA